MCIYAQFTNPIDALFQSTLYTQLFSIIHMCVLDLSMTSPNYAFILKPADLNWKNKNCNSENPHK